MTVGTMTYHLNNGYKNIKINLRLMVSRLFIRKVNIDGVMFNY
jgi:hypothetical protein